MPGSVAARSMAWQRRMGGAPGPLGASGEASTGAPVTVELLVNGVWVDITPYVMVRDEQGQITLTRGLRDEGNQTEQATGTLPLKNQDGRFTPRNAMGIWYGLIGRNQPIRISVPDGMGGKSYRLWGEIPKWPASWDPTGNDVWVDVSVNGILQRLAQGPAPERSVIYNAVANPLPSSVVAYWPCEDPSDATTIASALVSGSRMTISGTPTLASYSGFGASDPLPDLTTSSLSGGVVAYDEPTATQVRFLCFIPAIGLSDGKVICSIDQVDYSPGSAQFWELYYSATSTSLTLRMNASDGSFLGIELPHTLDVRGRQMYVSVEFQESGTAITRAVRITDVNTGLTYSVTDTANVTQLSRVTKVQFGPASRSAVGPNGTQFLPGVAIGHVTVENAITAVGALGVRLNPIGEAAGRRIQRLCGENGIAVDWIGDLDDTVDMGAQGKTNPLSLMQEAVLADDGLLYENLAALGLGYRTRASLYNQDPALILNYTGFNLAEVPTPVEDDRYLANKVTISVLGVTATYEETAGPLSTAPPPTGVGVYGPNADSALSLNLATSDTPTLLDQAAWRVHIGTVDEARHPQISVNLAHASITPEMRRAILSLRMGDRVQVINPPAWLGGDTIDQLVLGFEESITHFEHRITFTCAPASPYNTIGYLDTTARFDTDGSQLLTAIGPADTSMVVVPSPTQTVLSPGQWVLWTTDPAEFPFDLRLGGEVVRATGATPWLSDAFSRTVSNGWGSADTGQAWSVAGTASDYAVGSGVGSHILTTVTTTRRSFIDPFLFTNFDFYVDITTSATATGGSLFGGPAGRYMDSANLYTARMEFTTSNTLILSLRKLVNGNETSLGVYNLPDTYAPGTFFRIRFQAQGSVFRTKAWLASGVETPEWQISVVDGDISTANFIGLRSFSASSNTNVNPSVNYENANIINPQTFTMTRSINGITKAHAAGEDVRLANPTIISL
ncbi:hypothetical protein [Streptomyces sp. NPDC090798]|uniref:hypothetical protein n=1 Tax=Streptomyces sp. NPDC090798 TaxID=3365968 RepID=UPI00382EEFE7